MNSYYWNAFQLQEQDKACGREHRLPRCPFCGAECETIYYDRNGDAFACDACEQSGDAWDEPMCFPDNEGED